MSGVLQQPVRMYLVDDEARDVSRMTGLEWTPAKVHSKGIVRPFLDLRTLDYWDQFMVAWTMIGAYAYLDFGTYTK
jgi:hypothetical protein